VGICAAGARILQSELRSRFNRYIDLSVLDFDPAFIIATALDPRYKHLLTQEQKSCAKRHLIFEVYAMQALLFLQSSIH